MTKEECVQHHSGLPYTVLIYPSFWITALSAQTEPLIAYKYVPFSECVLLIFLVPGKLLFPTFIVQISLQIF